VTEARDVSHCLDLNGIKNGTVKSNVKVIFVRGFAFWKEFDELKPSDMVRERVGTGTVVKEAPV